MTNTGKLQLVLAGSLRVLSLRLSSHWMAFRRCCWSKNSLSVCTTICKHSLTALICSFNNLPCKSWSCWTRDFVGGFAPGIADDHISCLSRIGFFITFANCPISWSSNQQPIIALPSTEAEYIALSTALCDVVFIMQLTNELASWGVKIPFIMPIVCCIVFENNRGALELAMAPKL